MVHNDRVLLRVAHILVPAATRIQSYLTGTKNVNEDHGSLFIRFLKYSMNPDSERTLKIEDTKKSECFDPK